MPLPKASSVHLTAQRARSALAWRLCWRNRDLPHWTSTSAFAERRNRLKRPKWGRKADVFAWELALNDRSASYSRSPPVGHVQFSRIDDAVSDPVQEVG